MSSLDVFWIRRYLSLLCTLMSSALPSDQIRGYIQDSGDSGSAPSKCDRDREIVPAYHVHLFVCRTAVKTKRSAWGSSWCGELA
ncbi:hypothetical protein T08_4090 [Trichinella sp. T8]|nr:hypothetical protein T08_4090 [Trichinella sp. T8]